MCFIGHCARKVCNALRLTLLKHEVEGLAGQIKQKNKDNRSQFKKKKILAEKSKGYSRERNPYQNIKTGIGIFKTACK